MNIQHLVTSESLQRPMARLEALEAEAHAAGKTALGIVWESVQMCERKYYYRETSLAWCRTCRCMLPFGVVLQVIRLLLAVAAIQLLPCGTAAPPNAKDKVFRYRSYSHLEGEFGDPDPAVVLK